MLKFAKFPIFVIRATEHRIVLNVRDININ
jgi:hypothetical protein